MSSSDDPRPWQPPQPDPGIGGASPLPGAAGEPPAGPPFGTDQPPAPSYGAPPGYLQQPGYPPYGGYPAYPPQRGTNGLAIASLVLGILWLYWIGSILALVFGYVARRQIRERGEAGNGMAIAGIVLGWIGVATLVILIVVVIVLLPTDVGSSA